MPIVNLQLIYNVGMNNGDDTAFYLRRGFRVIEPGLELRLRHLLFGSLLDSRPLRFALALLDELGLQVPGHPSPGAAHLRTTVRPTSHGRPTQTDNPEKAAA